MSVKNINDMDINLTSFCNNKEDAITILSFIKSQYCKDNHLGNLKYIDALNMAIIALMK